MNDGDCVSSLQDMPTLLSLRPCPPPAARKCRRRAECPRWLSLVRRRATERFRSRTVRQIAPRTETLFSTWAKNQLAREFFLGAGSAAPGRWCRRFGYVELQFSCARLLGREQERAPQLLRNRAHFLRNATSNQTTRLLPSALGTVSAIRQVG